MIFFLVQHEVDLYIRYDRKERERKKTLFIIMHYYDTTVNYTRCQTGSVCWFFLSCNKHCIRPYYTYIDYNACSVSGAVTFSHAALQHLLHNLCCDWQASINLGSLCSIIISPAIQLDSTQQAAWHCGFTKEIPSEQAELLVASSIHLLCDYLSIQH